MNEQRDKIFAVDSKKYQEIKPASIVQYKSKDLAA